MYSEALEGPGKRSGGKFDNGGGRKDWPLLGMLGGGKFGYITGAVSAKGLFNLRRVEATL